MQCLLLLGDDFFILGTGFLDMFIAGRVSLEPLLQIRHCREYGLDEDKNE